MKEKNINNNAKDILSAYLKKNKMRQTLERDTILDIIYSIDDGFKIDELEKKINEKSNLLICRATIYNSIKIFIDANLIIKYQIKNETHYKRAYDITPTHNTICNKCGKTQTFTNKELQEFIKNIRYKNKLSISHYTLVVYGICSTCAKKIK